MDTAVMPQWLSERKVIRALPNGRKRILYVDNFSGYNEIPELSSALERIDTELRYFEPTITDYAQLCESFIIQMIKSECSTRSENMKWKRLWKINGKDIREDYQSWEGVLFGYGI